MTKFQTVLLAILSAAVAGALYKFVPDQGALSTGLAGLSVYLFGYAKQHPGDAKAIAAAKSNEPDASPASEDITKPLLPNPRANTIVIQTKDID